MKRATLGIVFFLFLGAIVNVTVAWGCVWVHGDVEADWSPYHNPLGLPLVVHVTSRLGYEQVRGVGRSGTLLDRHGDKVRQYRTGAWWPPEATNVLSEAYGRFPSNRDLLVALITTHRDQRNLAEAHRLAQELVQKTRGEPGAVELLKSIEALRGR